jgi:hypothetical protein
MDLSWKFLKYNLFLAALLCLPFFLAANTTGSGEGECDNYIVIQGSSNINQFQFVNHNPQINPSAGTHQSAYPYRHIRIPVHAFTGPGNRMLNDFFKMVNAPEHPYIQIEIEPRELADFDETTGMTNFETDITLAGVTRTYVVPCQTVFCESSGFVLKGDLEVELTDFKIDPPEKVFGAVKVNNEVFITFAFRFRSEEFLTEKVNQ